MISHNIILKSCNIEYARNLLPPHKASALFDSLKDTLEWKQESIKIYGKDILSPRLQCFYGDPDAHYRYSGKTFEPLNWIPELERLKNQLSQYCKESFNAVLCNFYRDGSDSMGWHSDNEPEMGRDPIIASVSLGAPRKFALRKKKETKQLLSLPLEHNSLLIMKSGCQSNYQHALPKTKAIHEARINLTFRRIMY